jgi:hypothetical protein
MNNKIKPYARCHATIESMNGRTVAYHECKDILECEKFYLELGHNFYANDEIKHSQDVPNGIHDYWLTVDDKKSMLAYVRTMAKNANGYLDDKTDEEIILFGLSYLGANIQDARLSGLELAGSNA